MAKKNGLKKRVKGTTGKHDNSSSRNGTEKERRKEEIATNNENFAKRSQSRPDGCSKKH